MAQEVSRFQERIALVLGGATLMSLAAQKRRFPWGGVALLGTGLLLIRGALDWLRSDGR